MGGLSDPGAEFLPVATVSVVHGVARYFVGLRWETGNTTRAKLSEVGVENVPNAARGYMTEDLDVVAVLVSEASLSNGA